MPRTRLRTDRVPTHEGFVYVDRSSVKALHPVPSLDIASERWTLFIAPPLPRRSSIIAQAHT
jgi:iron complex outermembrane receptor protein